MDDQLLLRYSRQILLPDIDIDGQQKLTQSHVLLIGLGGLGSPIAMYLAAAGVGHLTLVDHDTVELSNLQRQIVHTTASLAQPKVESAREHLLALNPHTTVDTIARQLDDAGYAEIVPQVDAVVDATDTFEARFAINQHCVQHRKPLISGAAIRFEGQVSVFHAGSADSPCYRCLYSDAAAVAETCSQTGVVAPLLGIIGSVQAMETLKVLLGIGTDLCGRLLLLDALSMEWQTMRFKKNPKCPACGSTATG